jgi:uncharacterized membrane protein YsdA (DUF1294 family)
MANNLLLSSMLLFSAIAFVAYGVDKRQAGLRHLQRVPEKYLHVLALLGGWPGALLGQRVFRHKRRKTRFLVVFRLCVAMHVGATVWLMARRF